MGYLHAHTGPVRLTGRNTPAEELVWYLPPDDDNAEHRTLGELGALFRFGRLRQAAAAAARTQVEQRRFRDALTDVYVRAHAELTAHYDTAHLLGEAAPERGAWRGYPDYSATAYLGAGHWLRWRQPDGTPRDADPDPGDLVLIAACPHRGHHEEPVTDLVSLAETVTAATRCDGSRRAGCYLTRPRPEGSNSPDRGGSGADPWADEPPF